MDRTATVKAGDRCQLHPATDSWMKGDRFGDVLTVFKANARHSFERVRVRLDKSGRTITFPAASVLPVQ